MISPLALDPLAWPSTHFFFVHASLFHFPWPFDSLSPSPPPPPSPPLSSLWPPLSSSLLLLWCLATSLPRSCLLSSIPLSCPPPTPRSRSRSHPVCCARVSRQSLFLFIFLTSCSARPLRLVSSAALFLFVSSCSPPAKTSILLIVSTA